jgi:hypothetical protein
MKVFGGCCYALGLRQILRAFPPLLLVGFVSIPAFALADCRNGAAPSYSDISAVMFERNGCGGFTHKPDDLECSSYWVYFGKDFKTTYSQATKSIGRGAFSLDSSLQEAREVLRRHDFFNLAPPDITASDIMESILTVRRCKVVTKVLMYPIVQFSVHESAGTKILQLGGDPEVAELFAEFDAMVARGKKKKVSDHFLYFNLNVFDPTGFSPPAQCKGDVPFGIVGVDCS